MTYSGKWSPTVTARVTAARRATRAEATIKRRDSERDQDHGERGRECPVRREDFDPVPSR